MNITGTPGLRGQTRARTSFRVVGLVLLAMAIGLLVVGLHDFFSSFGSDSADGPHRFWMVFVGLVMLGPAGWCLQAGFMGSVARYAAGETMPVLKDSAAYLTDGQGVLGIGRTADDAVAATAGPFCSRCGTRNDETATFCDSCGAALAR